VGDFPTKTNSTNETAVSFWTILTIAPSRTDLCARSYGQITVKIRASWKSSWKYFQLEIFPTTGLACFVHGLLTGPVLSGKQRAPPSPAHGGWIDKERWSSFDAECGLFLLLDVEFPTQYYRPQCTQKTFYVQRSVLQLRVFFSHLHPSLDVDHPPHHRIALSHPLRTTEFVWVNYLLPPTMMLLRSIIFYSTDKPELRRRTRTGQARASPNAVTFERELVERRIQ